MGEKSEIRVKFEIGEIKFEAEGSADLVERERSIFNNTLLPAAIDAIVRTRGVTDRQYVEPYGQPDSIVETTRSDVSDTPQYALTTAETIKRTSLSSFIGNYGVIGDQDFTVLAAYYDEKKNGTEFFTSETVKQYYNDARRTQYSNVSGLLRRLVQKGLIMDNPNSEKTTPKQYILTDFGLNYAKTYQPNKENSEKPKKARTKRAHSTIVSTYSSLCADDLNLCNYPEIKSQKTFKKQMILLLFIVTKEGKGEFFTVADIQYLMTDMLGLPASIDQINGIIEKNKSWFKKEQDENNKKAYKRKLLQGALDFAQAIVDEASKN